MLFSLCCWGAAPETVSVEKGEKEQHSSISSSSSSSNPPTITQPLPHVVFLLLHRCLFLILPVKQFYSTEIVDVGGGSGRSKRSGYFHSHKDSSSALCHQRLGWLKGLRTRV